MTKLALRIAESGISYRRIDSIRGKPNAARLQAQRGIRPTRGPLGERNAKRVAMEYSKILGCEWYDLVDDDDDLLGDGDIEAEINMRYSALYMYLMRM